MPDVTQLEQLVVGRGMDGGASGASPQAPHGTKRRADDDPRDDQRLAKRFNLLNIGNFHLSASIDLAPVLIRVHRAKWQTLHTRLATAEVSEP